VFASFSLIFGNEISYEQILYGFTVHPTGEVISGLFGLNDNFIVILGRELFKLLPGQGGMLDLHLLTDKGQEIRLLDR